MTDHRNQAYWRRRIKRLEVEESQKRVSRVCYAYRVNGTICRLPLVGGRYRFPRCHVTLRFARTWNVFPRWKRRRT